MDLYILIRIIRYFEKYRAENKKIKVSREAIPKAHNFPPIIKTSISVERLIICW
jgi:hypothetical protein